MFTNSMNSISVGEIVKLKSGGPYMTVTQESEASDEVTCTWFSQTGTRREHVFRKYVLIGIAFMPDDNDIPF